LFQTFASNNGGGTSPAGSITQIQFNNAGFFGASADLRMMILPKVLSLNGVDTDIFT
jgi:hypothetical protein